MEKICVPCGASESKGGWCWSQSWWENIGIGIVVVPQSGLLEPFFSVFFVASVKDWFLRSGFFSEFLFIPQICVHFSAQKLPKKDRPFPLTCKDALGQPAGPPWKWIHWSWLPVLPTNPKPLHLGLVVCCCDNLPGLAPGVQEPSVPFKEGLKSFWSIWKEGRWDVGRSLMHDERYLTICSWYGTWWLLTDQ